MPYAFTELGVAMLSSVLSSDVAIQANIRIMRAFSVVRRLIAANEQMYQRIAHLEYQQDDTALTMLDKRAAGVSATIYTMQISKPLQLDIDKHNSQYPAIDVKVFRNSHDRFLIVDDKVYHFGASIKDLGKKWFAFNLMTEYTADELLNRL